MTEGRMGCWGEVEKFFRSLQGKPVPTGNILESLDNSEGVYRPNRPRGAVPQGSFRERDSYTQRTLFERIVEELRKHKPASEEEEDLVHKKLWHLLGRFVFQLPRSKDSIVKEIDSLLLAVSPSDRRIAEKREAMVTGLGERATTGNAEIVVAEFLDAYGLGAVPLTRSGWPTLRQRSAALLKRQLDRKGYVSGEDVRTELANEAYVRLADPASILVLTSESGQGKSWLLYALGLEMLSEPAFLVLIDATRDAERMLERGAREFIEEIWNQDEGPSLRRLGTRIRQSLPQLAPRWLTLLIDGVQDLETAQDLAQVPWEDWGIRLLITCSPQAAENIRVASAGRSVEYKVRGFSAEELERFLTQYYGDEWVDIAANVRSTLRRPLLASIYRQVAEAPGWEPTSGYSLFERFWDRLREGRQADHPSDALLLHRLALGLLDDGACYPWTIAQVHDAEIKMMRSAA